MVSSFAIAFVPRRYTIPDKRQNDIFVLVYTK